jgi:hypothetical protein
VGGTLLWKEKVPVNGPDAKDEMVAEMSLGLSEAEGATAAVGAMEAANAAEGVDAAEAAHVNDAGGANECAVVSAVPCVTVGADPGEASDADESAGRDGLVGAIATLNSDWLTDPVRAEADAPELYEERKGAGTTATTVGSAVD